MYQIEWYESYDSHEDYNVWVGLDNRQMLFGKKKEVIIRDINELPSKEDLYNEVMKIKLPPKYEDKTIKEIGIYYNKETEFGLIDKIEMRLIFNSNGYVFRILDQDGKILNE